ncbi:hypothetical protein K2173_001740 [Erythroxylum novogranatense]|uniref:Pentatricopeptide repeat-containing protein n=1 Tax=Erythroxylum novogranatense TaxID=1862640 RepID=A0AAV8S8E9_9ROSI|nr:hypothetical protein K2173_001740 [Erythroxylum novogranatense]
MLHSCYDNCYRQPHRSLQQQEERRRHHSLSLCKPFTFHSSLKGRVFPGFYQLRHRNFPQTGICSFPNKNSQPVQPTRQTKIVCSPPLNQSSQLNGVPVGFKLRCQSNTVTLASKSSFVNGKKRKYGSVLPSILRSLDSDDDIEETLNSYYENLNAKEQTVILKEQRNWKRVLRVFDFFKSQKDYVPNVIHYNIVLRALGRAQRWDELRLCWIEMAKNGILPTNNTYGMLIDVYGKAGLVMEALMWIKHMRLRALFPDEVTMSTVVRVLKDVGEFERAHRFYKDWSVGRVELDGIELDTMIGKENGSGSVPISFKHFLSTELFRTGGRTSLSCVASRLDAENVSRKPKLTSTYNTLIDLYGKAGRLKDAADVFAEMLKSGVPMDTITFNTMMFICGSKGHLSEAESLLNKMEERRISPDTKTYNILLSLYAKAGNIDATLKCYHKITEKGLFPDIVTYRAIIHILCQKNMVKEVEAVIDEIQKSGECLDEHSVPCIIKMYVNEGFHDKARNLLGQFKGNMLSKTRASVMDVYAEKGLWAEAEAVFNRNKNLMEWKRDVLEYNVMIKAYGKGKLYNKAISLFKSMRNQGTWPDECSYNSLIQMLSAGDLVDHAREHLAEMKGAGFKPTCQTFSCIIACYVRHGQLSDAVDLFHEMVDTGVKPNEVVFGAIINGFAENKKVEEAIQYFQMMEGCGIPGNQIVLTSLIKLYSKLGKLDEARKLYQKMKDLKGGADTCASNCMINLYAHLGMVSEAESIFNNLRERGEADRVSFESMMYLYKNMAMLDKAADVAEKMKQSGLLMNRPAYKKVMACYVINGQLRECGELLHEMISQNIVPDRQTFRMLFSVLKKGGVPTEIVRQLQTSYQKGKPYAKQAVIASVFSTVGLHDLALKLCDTMRKSDIDLDSFAYNVPIYAYGLAGEIDKALNTYMKMKDEGLEPDLVTSINLVRCYGKAGMVEGVRRIYTQLKYGGKKPSDSLLKAIVGAYKSANRHDLAELVNQERKVGFDLEQYSDSDSQLHSDSETESESNGNSK